MPLPVWKKILVVDLGFLGDTVHSIPALRALAQTGAEVDVMTTPVGAEVLSMVPEVHRVWITPLRKPSPPWWKGLAQLLEIRVQTYDTALTFSAADRNLICTALSGAREKIGIRSPRGGRGILPLTTVLQPPTQEQPLFRQRISLLKKLGWSGDLPGWALQIPANVEKQTQSSLPPASVYLSVSAFGSRHKEWPLRNWAAAVRCFWERRPETSFLVGFAPGKREEERARQLVELAGNPQKLRALDAAPTIVELAAILRQTIGFAGLDSGVLHLAMALGKPTVSVFREYSGKSEWVPAGQNHRVISRPCSCHQDQIDRCGSEPRCLAAVPPADVAEAMLELLPLAGQRI